MQNKKVLIIVVIGALILCAGLYFLGLWQGRGQLLVERNTYTAQIQQLTDKLDAAEGGNKLLEARIALYRAAADLDQRNFGMANARLQEAAKILTAVEPSKIDVDPARLEALRREVTSTSIAVALDLEQQRIRLLSLAWQLDQLTPGGVPPPTPFTAASPEPAPYPAPAPGMAQPPAPAPAPGASPAQGATPAPITAAPASPGAIPAGTTQPPSMPRP